MLDTWPESIGIPTLRQAYKELDFVEKCLSEEEERQIEAAEHIGQAMLHVEKAIKALTKD